LNMKVPQNRYVETKRAIGGITTKGGGKLINPKRSIRGSRLPFKSDMKREKADSWWKNTRGLDLGKRKDKEEQSYQIW